MSFYMTIYALTNVSWLTDVGDSFDYFVSNGFCDMHGLGLLAEIVATKLGIILYTTLERGHLVELGHILTN